jgi:methylmalonic aciduria homocystinuria type C protein
MPRNRAASGRVWQARAVITAIAEAGFDVAHAFDAHALAAVPGWERLADGPRTGILVGNTRTLWPRFTAAVAADAALAADPNKLERYTERTLGGAFPGALIYYSHRRYGRGFLPFQKLAVALGVGAIAPIGLVVHPEYGPWFALRAVVLVDREPPAAVAAPIALPCTCGAACGEALDRAQREMTWQAWLGVRDACSLRACRYSDEQIRYHYTHAWPGS